MTCVIFVKCIVKCGTAGALSLAKPSNPVAKIVSVFPLPIYFLYKLMCYVEYLTSGNTANC